MLVQDLLVHEGAENRVALLDKGRTFTYRQLQDLTAMYRDYLYSLGVRAHDHVAVFSRNSAEYIIASMAIASLGAVTVPINFQLRQREIAYILKDAEVKIILTYQHIDGLEEALEAFAYGGIVKQYDITFWKKVEVKAPALPADFSENEPCNIIYTSGTTGSPKGAVLSHKNLVRNAEQMQHQMHIAVTDNVLCVLPMYHCFAWTCAVLNPLFVGAQVTIIDSFTPKETLELIRNAKVTAMYAVPSICSLIARLGKKEDLETMRLVVSGGTTMPVQIAKDFMDKFGLSISEGYGLSETSPVVTMNPPNKTKIGSIGPLIEGVEARIVDEEGNDVKPGEPGELLVKGDNVMLGYWNLPEATAKALQDGWLHTGDVAKVDEDGYYYIVDRIKDLIISMGENIYPREIEELLYAYPGIVEASVIGVEDKLRGTAGCCFYCLEENSDFDIKALKKYLQQNLALYKIPREFHKIDSLPRTGTGKISKILLKKMYDEMKRK